MNKKIKGLETLEKINDHKLDQLRLELSQMRLREEELQKMRCVLLDREMAEKTITSDYPQLGLTLGAYMQSNGEQQRAIGSELTQLAADMETILEDIRDLYQEGKKLETVIKQANQEIKKEELNQEQKVMDHLAEIRQRASLQ